MSDVEQQIAEEMGDEEPETQDVTPDDGEGTTEGAGAEGAAAAAPAPRTQKEIEAVQRALEKEAERHAKKVADIMGDDFAMLVPSPVDWTPGFIFAVEGMLPGPAALEQLDAILGRDARSDLLPAEDAQGCEKCAALGEVLTGSRKDGQITKPCSSCNGTGWTHKLAPAPAPAPPSPIYGANVTANVAPGGGINQDAWGRQIGHPHFGLAPAQVGV